MRRLAAVTAVALMALVGSACEPGLSRAVSGSFTGTSTYEAAPFAGDCQVFHQVYDASYVRRQGARGGTFRLDGCVIPTAGPFLFDGTFVLTDRGGSQLTGTVTGEIFPLSFTLTVTDGTKRFEGVTGTIRLEGIWDGANGGAIEGTLRAALERADRERITI